MRAGLVASAIFLAACGTGTAAPVHMSPVTSTVAVFEDEDLSGPPMTEPVSVLVVAAPLPGAYACDASDAAGLDKRQLYVSCGEWLAAGGVFSVVGV